ncbi:naringenin,2-oxoglutarate 3-dioxygenase-like [Cryptomeria japonica]|uniref:naringenin,2-oxoglutarate 3-dioxygenase-like n=1 Tax=Cryptomeria japonica TaxID=3369 RepID=UPI0025ABBBAB|nr:naringenin,2-oxoglutarate 3-dioxygenase-like [Cryptomeria japonica]
MIFKAVHSFIVFDFCHYISDHYQYKEDKVLFSIIADYSAATLELARELLELISEALGLESKAIENACGDAEQKLLLNYYPKYPRPDLTLGLKRHTDPGTITLLLQDKVGGLQDTKDDGRTWVTVEPIDGAFVVNLGDQMHVVRQWHV